MKHTKNEISYEQAADVLGCSSRNVRRLIKRLGIQPIVRGYRTVSLPAEKIIRLKFKLVMQKRSNHQASNGHGHTNGKGRR